MMGSVLVRRDASMSSSAFSSPHEMHVRPWLLGRFAIADVREVGLLVAMETIWAASSV